MVLRIGENNFQLRTPDDTAEQPPSSSVSRSDALTIPPHGEDDENKIFHHDSTHDTGDNVSGPGSSSVQSAPIDKQQQHVLEQRVGEESVYFRTVSGSYVFSLFQACRRMNALLMMTGCYSLF